MSAAYDTPAARRAHRRATIARAIGVFRDFAVLAAVGFLAATGAVYILTQVLR